jgi:AcrR family transcriptional regulator
MSENIKENIFNATLDAIMRVGFSKLTIDEVARTAKVSRTTFYKYFPNGRDQLISEVVSFEAFRWLGTLANEINDIPDLQEASVKAIMFAYKSLKGHEVLNKVLTDEPEIIMPLLSVEAVRVVSFIHLYIVSRLLEARIEVDVDLDMAADYIARMMLSLVTSPGRWDLSDETQVRTLVRAELLSPVLKHLKS